MSDVVVRTRVAAPPAVAFQRFTAEVDAWWKRGPRFRFDPEGREGALAFEGHEGGRFLEHFGEGEALEVGVVVRWDPPGSFVFRLHPPAPGAGPGTMVEVRFVAAGDATTEVVLTHRGLDEMPAGGRMGRLRSTALRSGVSVWWADLLRGLC